MADIVMKISRKEYLELNNTVNALKAENANLKAELNKKAKEAAAAKVNETKKKEDK